MKKSIWTKIYKEKVLYFMLLPCMAYGFLFSYWPLRGWIMAFQNFKPAKGYLGSEFVGFKHFIFLFGEKEFGLVLRNTLVMSLLVLVLGNFCAIGFALLLNEMRAVRFKKLTQTISYLPHFLSWIIVCSLVTSFLSSDGGINEFLIGTGLVDKPILFLLEEKYFWWVATFSNIWKETGWNSIIFIAAIMGIDPSLYEVADLDGASRFRKMWHVTLPGIKSTIVVIIIMNLGWVLNSMFEIPYLLGDGLLIDVSQTLDIYVLKYGIALGNYSLATAAGLFKTVVSLVLVFGTNKLANILGENSLM